MSGYRVTGVVEVKGVGGYRITGGGGSPGGG